MNVGYVRLSRDDDKKNYTSIENQKELILAYAKQNGFKIDRFYEDDGISGYLFNRPAFAEMLDKLETDIDVVIAKDLSRIGRNNGKVLLLLDRFQELEKRLILIDDNYDTYKNDDDIIGIKTWYNERYVKDTSKKIRSVMKLKQKEGNYICNAPFGYYIKNKKFYIRDNEADIVKRIYNMYVSGYGYRNIANAFNDEGVPTPSVLIMQNLMAEGKLNRKQVATKWSDNMVRDILKNDFYIGVFRNYKRERKVIHGTDRRISKSEQLVFKDRHEKIIDENTFNLAQELMVNRKRSNYRGSRYNHEISTFGSVLYCNDCGSKLTPITRQTETYTRKYYICSRYNSDGKKFCSSAHLINENDLLEFTLDLINACKSKLEELIKSYDINDYKKEKEEIQKNILGINKKITEAKEKLKSIIGMKLNDIAKYPDNQSIIEETYAGMQNEVMSCIALHENELKDCQIKLDNSFEERHENISNAYEIIQNIGQNLNRQDVEYIIKKITIDSNGIPYVYFRYDINNYIDFNIIDIINSKEDNIIKSVYKIIKEEKRIYTSAKYLSKKLEELGIKKSKKSVIPYINLAIADGILEKTEDPLKPYNIVINKEKIICD